MKQTSVILFSVALATAASAQGNTKELPSVDVAAELAAFQLAPGLEMSLFAAEPLIAKPIQMAWDDKGRLWVATSSIYPHIKPGQTEADKIVVLEDTDKDGKADKSTIFYEGLLIPTGILPGDGGAYVANSTELLFMKDTDGDGRADVTKVLLSGFGTEDTHHILHSIKRGPDGCLYFAQSVYIHSRIETPYGVRELRGSGWWQYRPETGRLEVYSMGQINPWGLVWDSWGQTFSTDGAGGEGMSYTFPGATFISFPNQLPRVLVGLNPGQPKHCGLEIISGRHFPDEWQGQLVTADFRGHRVNRFTVKTEGSGFSSQQMEDVVSSTHGSFRPVDEKMGPDGALYLADWFNPIIQHGEVDFHDPRRDREHGRIWRIAAKGRELSPLPDYAKASVNELLELLRAPEDWVRIAVKQELKQRKVEHLDKIVLNWVSQPNCSDAMKLEALGLLQTIGELNATNPLLDGSGSADFLAYAVRSVGQIFREGADGKGDLVYGAVVADSARVRLEAVNALRMMKRPEAVERALLVLNKPMDPNIDFALWLTCRELADVWLPAFQKGEITFGGDVGQIAFALKAADRPEAMGTLLDLVFQGKVAGERVQELLLLVGDLGSKEDLARLTELAAAPKASAGMVEAVQQALITAARQRNLKINSASLAHLTNLGGLPSLLAIRLNGVYQLEGGRSQLEGLALQGGPLTVAALEALVDLGGASTIHFLIKFAETETNTAWKDQALAMLFKLDANVASRLAVDYLGTLEDPLIGVRIMEACLARKDGPNLLAAALKGRKLNSLVARAAVQKAGAAGIEAQALIESLTKSGGLDPINVGMSGEEMLRMMAEVKEKGDAARGELIYRKQAMLCQSCHAIGAVGGVVGPDLLSIGASAPLDYIIESLLEPSKKIKEGYATTLVNTKNGGVFSGFMVRENVREVILRDALGATQSIPAAEISGKQSMPVSLMPPGLTASLRRDEFVDLVRFLSELGKEGKYKVQSDGVIRRWRLPQLAPEFGQVLNRDGLRALTKEQPGVEWMPVYSAVSGDLPLADIPEVKLFQISGRVAQGDFEVTTIGPMVLKFAEAKRVRAWVDDEEITPSAVLPLELPVGRHKITVLLDDKRVEALRVEVEAAAGSEARVVPVGGI